MRLDDIKIDGTTEYECRKEQKTCVIQASFVDDGAALIAYGIDNENFMDLWATEACYLSPAESSDK